MKTGICVQSRAHRRRPFLLALLAGSAALASAPAYGEDAAEAAAVEAPDQSEIIVTAQKRQERLVDVPVAVAVVTPEQIRQSGAKDLVDIARMTPGVIVSPQISGGRTIQTFTIRGVGYDDFRPNGNPSAAVNIDGVYQGSAALVGAQMFDIARIEILKGPQGTLYGQNTTAGAVNIISRQPSDDFTGEGRVEYGRYNSFRAEAGIGGPVAQGVKFRLSGVFDRTDGFMTNLGTGPLAGTKPNPAVPGLPDPGFDAKANRDKYFAGRAIFQIDPAYGTAITLNAHGMRETGAVQLFERTRPVRGYPVLAPFTTNSEAIPQLSKSSYGASATLKQDIGDKVVFYAIAGYEHLKQRYAADGDLIPQRWGTTIYRDDDDQGTLELRLQNAHPGKIDWVIGASGFIDKVRIRSNLDMGDLTLSVIEADYRQKRRNAGVFADGTINLGGGVKLGGGLRYTSDRITFRGVTRDLDPYGVSIAQRIFGPLPFAFSQEFTDSNVSGRVNLSYQIAPDANAYVTVRRGYKSGGFDGSTSFTLPEVAPFQSEQVWSYEAGVKFFPRGGPVQIEASVFYNDYQNMQASANKLINGLIPSNVRTNVGSSRVYGAELNIIARPAENFELQLGVSALNSKILKIDSRTTEVERLRRLGNELPFAPKLTLNGSILYHIPFSENVILTPSVNGRFVDNYYTELDNYQPIRGYFLGNAQIDLEIGQKFSISGWVRNFTDVRYATTLYVAPPTYAQMRGSPRTYGLSVGYQF